MKELEPENLVIYGASLLVVAILTPLLGRAKRTHENPLHHVIFAVLAGVALFFLPEFIQDELFSPGGVVVVGTMVHTDPSVDSGGVHRGERGTTSRGCSIGSLPAHWPMPPNSWMTFAMHSPRAESIGIRIRILLHVMATVAFYGWCFRDK